MFRFRTPIHLGIVFAVAVLCPSAQASKAATSATKPKRPNILLVIADDWGATSAGALGEVAAHTPNFDRLMKEGTYFRLAFSAAPSCSPSRASLLTGQAVPRLAEAANLWSIFPTRFAVYPELLERSGYSVGLWRKGWGPGSTKKSGRDRNPAGPAVESFRGFLKDRPQDKPFCFWLGSWEPHRPYDVGLGKKRGIDPSRVRVPGYLPDVPEVREDLTNYLGEVEDFDTQLGDAVAALKEQGILDDTLIVVTSDNGLPFPRAKATLYDAGTHVPLLLRWPRHVDANGVVNSPITLTDLAPTFLEAAGLPIPREMTGRSLLSLSKGKRQSKRDAAFTALERHSESRKGTVGYPGRAIRTTEFLYIRNFHPERWPAGDPDWEQEPFRDIDGFGSLSKTYLLEHRSEAVNRDTWFSLATGKRPPEELFDLRKDPSQLKNVAGSSEYQKVQRQLSRRLDRWMESIGDPRAHGAEAAFDGYEYIREADRH